MLHIRSQTTAYTCKDINSKIRGLLREYNQRHEIPMKIQLYHVSLVSWTMLRGKICNVFFLVRMLVKRIQNELLTFHKFITITYHEMRRIEAND